jgi:hypothetical protein
MHADDIKERVRSASSDRWRAELAVYLLAHGLCTDAKLAQTAVYHAYLMHWLKGIMRTDCLTYQKIILSWITEYWRRTFESQRFQFRTPPLVSEDIRQACSSPEAKRAQKILLAVGRGLGLQFPPEIQKWLEETS